MGVVEQRRFLPFCSEEARHRGGDKAKRATKKFPIIIIFSKKAVSCLCPAFLSAFTSHDNDKGRLFEQAHRESGGRSELRPTRYRGLFF
jgi:hypothetical protein